MATTATAAPTRAAEAKAARTITPRRPPAGRIFIVAFVLVFLAEAAWSYATPLLGAPDEPSQIVKAAAVVRGQWTALCYGSTAPDGKCLDGPANELALGLVTLPTFYDLVRAPDSIDPPNSQICFHAKATVPASCARSLNRAPSAVEVAEGLNRFVWTYQSRYPPLYYAIVGLPSLLGSGTWAIYLMRLVSAVLSALFLALAATVVIAWSTSRLLRLGLFVAATPMVFFLGGVVNPSGLEIAAAIACWTALLVLVTERDHATRRPLIFAAAGSALAFELTRGLSPFWLALVLVVVALAAAPGRLRQLWRDHLAVGAGVAVAVVGVLAVIWILVEHATLIYTTTRGVPASTSELSILKQSFHHNVYYLPGMIGIFGWFDARSPAFTFVIWYVVSCALLLAALVRTSGRRRLLLVAVVVAILGVPVLISSSQARKYGFVWAGRDTLPFAVGLPLVAAVFADAGGLAVSPRLFRRIGSILGVLVWIAGVGGFVWAMRRWSVGTLGAQFDFLVHPGWRPATGLVLPLVVEVTALAAAYALALLAPVRRAAPVAGGDEEVGEASQVDSDPEAPSN